MINDKDFILIESYLEGALVGEEKKSFEERLRKEEELSKYLTLMIESNLYLQDYAKKQKIEEWTRIIHEQPLPQPSFINRVMDSQLTKYALSIAAVLLFCLALYLLFPTSTSTPQQLADQYWSETARFSYDNARRGDTPKPIEDFTKKIYELHEEKEYRAALNSIEQLAVADEKMTLLKGSCYYHLGEIENAIRTFQQITTLQNSYTEDEAKWYIALSYLKKGDTQMSKKELQEIADRKLWNHKIAKVLLKRIP